MSRVYLDHNATMPLRDEARAAMMAAMDVVGNPSSVHAEGRAAKAVIEKAREDLANAFGADGADVVFTSGATEAAVLALHGRGLIGTDVEHDAVSAQIVPKVQVNSAGRLHSTDQNVEVLQVSNSETGVVQDLPGSVLVSDATQAFGKMPVAFNWMGVEMALISAHKLGGPKGVGALVVQRGTDVAAQITGGGQEMGRRSGTENVIGIAGFAAAAVAAQRELDDGVWDRVRALRDGFEARVMSEAETLVIAGLDAPRMPNTSCLITPGWKGETQVMQMDLAGFAISAGSACSSGKVKSSRVLRAMGFDDVAASSAIRVSLGPQTTKEEMTRFADAWLAKRKKHQDRAGARTKPGQAA